MIAKWQALMAKVDPRWDLDEEPDYCMLDTIVRIGADQRAASIAASMMRWFGTNVGRCFLGKGKDLLPALSSRAYLAAWAVENQREYGLRLIHHVLSLQSLEDSTALGSVTNPNKRPHLTTRDYEVCELVAAWLGKPKGQAFLAECEAEIQERLKQESAERMARHLSSLEARQNPAATTAA